MVDYLVWATILAGVLIFLALNRKKQSATRRETGPASPTALPVTPIRDLKVGERVRIVGSALSTGPYVTAPMTKKMCLAYRTDVIQEGIFRKEPPQATDAVRFQVSNSDGHTVQVVPEYVSLDLDTTKDNLNPNSDGLQYTEAVLEEETLVSVTGTVEQGADGKLTLGGTLEQPVVISNRMSAV
jgi:hypothetical protein